MTEASDTEVCDWSDGRFTCQGGNLIDIDGCDQIGDCPRCDGTGAVPIGTPDWLGEWEPPAG